MIYIVAPIKGSGSEETLQLAPPSPIRYDLTAMDGGNDGNAGAITSGSELLDYKKRGSELSQTVIFNVLFAGFCQLFGGQGFSLYGQMGDNIQP